MATTPGRTTGRVSFWRWAPATAVLAFSAAAASAQTADPARWALAAQAFGGGWNSLSSPYLYKTPSSTAVVGFGNAPAFGLAAGVNATCLLGLELSWTQTNPAQQYATSPPTPIRNVIMNIFELDSLWYFHRGTFQAYGTVGLGGRTPARRSAGRPSCLSSGSA